MDEAEFEFLERIEESHWWFQGKRRLLRALLGDRPHGRRMLDLGCGVGGIFRDLPRDTVCVSLDGSARALEICRRKGIGPLVRADVGALPFTSSTFETVLVLDVIEHVRDDVGLLAQVREVCTPGARVVVAVPAFQLLWSRHDVTFKHVRRYTRSQLERAVVAAGLVPERLTYTNFFVFPVAALWRVLSFRLGLGRWAPGTDFWRVPGWLNGMLATMYRLEARMLRRWDLPVGVSAVCIARTPDGALPSRVQAEANGKAHAAR